MRKVTQSLSAPTEGADDRGLNKIGGRDSMIPGNCLCREGFGKQMMNLIKIEGHDLIKSCTLPLSRYFSVGHLLILKGYTDFKKNPVL